MSRWLIVTGDLPPAFVGGVASFVDDLARAAVEAGHQVTVLGRAARGHQRAAARAWDAAAPYAVRRALGRSWGRWQAGWINLAGGGLLSKVDRVVFATWPLAAQLGPRARDRGLPVAIHFHGSDLTRLAAPDRAFRAALGSASALLPVSDFLASELDRLGFQATGRMPMPLRLPSPASPPGDRAGLLCVARLTPLKGVDRAIRLAQALGTTLTVIGDGPEQAALQALAGPETRFLGRLDRVRTLTAYDQHAACLLLSREDADGSGAEGLGLTLIEAQARGCGAIGCRTGGIPEATGPGLVLDDPDAPDLTAVRRYLADPQAPARGRAWVEERHGGARAVACIEAAS